jgi:amino acid transporter
VLDKKLTRDKGYMKKTGKISFADAVLMSINVMIGAGILYAVGPMTSSAGSISFMGWPLIGLLLFPVIWSVAKAAQIFPGEGGFYQYCSVGIHPTVGFIAHWGYLLGYMGTAASLAWVLRDGFIKNLGITFFEENPIVFNLLLVSAYTLLNLLPIERISKIQSIGTILKLTPIIMVIGLLAFYFHPNLDFNFGELSNLGMTVSPVIFAFWGFEACCSMGGHLRDGPQKVASVILVGFFATMALYGLFHIGLLYIMGPENLGSYGAIAFPRYLGFSPTLTAALQAGIIGAILFSWANSILGVSLGNITIINFLAKNRLILGEGALTQVNSNQRPVYAAVVHGAVLFLLITFITSIDVLVALTNFGVLIALVLTLVAVFRNHLQQRNMFQLFVTSIAFLSCAALFYYSWIKIPSAMYTIPLIVGMVVGMIMYVIQLRRNQQPASVKVEL